MKKLLLIALIIPAVLSLSFLDETLQVLIPGVGIENYVTIDASTKTEIKTKFGSDFKEVEHYTTQIGTGNKTLYSTELQYKHQGVSFYFRPGSDTVFALRARSPYKCKTGKGIVLGTSTMQDVQDAYGKTEWIFAGDLMFLEYPGIAFYVPFKGKFPVSETVQQAALKKKVEIIGITAFDKE